MEIQEDGFKMFIETFQNMGGSFHVLENRVPVAQQMEYFDYSYKLRKKKLKKLKESDFCLLEEKLASAELPKEEKKKILTILALSSEVRAYRLLEQYMQQPDEELINWASMALIESRIAIESDLSGEKQIFISSGLGGKEGKLRFYVLFPSVKGASFEDYQRKVIETEFGEILPKNDCEVERLTIKENYVELVFLMPFTTNIRVVLESAVSECNLYGNFLSPVFTVTNVKEFSQDEVNQTLAKSIRKRK